MNRPHLRKTLFTLTALAIGTLSTSLALAEGEPGEAATTTAMSIGTSLAAQETTVPGGVLLIAAYIALWLLFFAYLAFIMRRQQALNKDLENLERRMDEVLGINEPR